MFSYEIQTPLVDKITQLEIAVPRPLSETLQYTILVLARLLSKSKRAPRARGRPARPLLWCARPHVA